MSDATTQTTKTTTQTKDQQPAPKKERHIATWIALVSALAAIIAAVISEASVNVAKAQNNVAEQQQLVTITTNIEEQFTDEQTTENQAAGNLTGTARSIAVANAALGLTAELTAEAQAGAVLVTNLHGNGVAGIEYVELGRALANYGDTAQAITYYSDAVEASPSDVPTRADALRFEAALFYSLGQNTIGHRDMMQAAKIYGGHPELTRSLIDNSIAQAYLEDAGYQTPIDGCHVAGTDLADAQHAIAPLGTNGVDTAVQALVGTVSSAYQGKCASIPGPTPPSAPVPANPSSDDYVAVEFSHSLDQAYVGESPQKDLAGGIAEKSCRQAGAAKPGYMNDCAAAEWVRYGYVAVAVTRNSPTARWGWASGWGPTLAIASSQAVKFCANNVAASYDTCTVRWTAATPNAAASAAKASTIGGGF
jgi:tetratricopeptide (TPR) repeat protein